MKVIEVEEGRMKMVMVLAAFAAAAAIAAPANAAQEWGCNATGYAGGYSWTGSLAKSAVTSCPFAQRVMRAATGFVIRHGGVGNGDFYVRVYSPVTAKWYWMNCEADGDIRGWDGIAVDCRGGVGARVRYTARIH